MTRSGFTLIEVLVVIAIITVLMGVLLPSLSAARDKAKETTCRAILRDLGAGIMGYSVANGDYYCSGAFDPEVSNGRDGPVDQVGWVADLVNSNSGFPARQLCPTNPARYNQKLGPNGNTYTEQEAADLVARGYNTNYTQGWYMARTEWNPGSNDPNTKRVASTFGPLQGSRMSVSTSRVPLLGDGRTDLDDLVLGERSVKTMTDGPFDGPFGTQNYADFGPAHGRGSWVRFKDHNAVRANVLFADGHVTVFEDRDRDGEFAIDQGVDPPGQKDLNQDIFDGVFSIGRRSLNAWELQ